MIESTNKHGEKTVGFMPMLEEIFGEGSFDEGNEEERFKVLTESESQLGGRLVLAWESLQTEVSTLEEGPPETGILSMPVEAAGLKPEGYTEADRESGGRIVKKPQKAITMEIENTRFGLRFEQLKETDVPALSATDKRRSAFMNIDRVSQSVVNSIPFSDEVFGNTDYRTAMADY